MSHYWSLYWVIEWQTPLDGWRRVPMSGVFRSFREAKEALKPLAERRPSTYFRIQQR